MFDTIYTHNRDRSIKYATTNDEEDMTQQSDLAESDINIIMQRYNSTGQMPQLIEPGQYGDFSDVGDYRDAMDKIREADAAFLEVPAKIRKDFDNDPAKFYAFVNDPENLPKLREMGLANPEEKPKPSLAEEIATAIRETRYNDDGETTYERDPKNGNRPERHEDRGPNRQPDRPGNPGRQGLPEGRR